jgi:hypothetical protein
MKRALSLAAVVLGVTTSFTGHLAAKADATRTVYFSATDDKGAAVTDLTAADLAVKENGKDRGIASVKPATAPVQAYILVDDGGSGAFQGPVAQFIDKMLGHAEFAISVLNPQPIKVVDFTKDIEALKGAIPRLGQRGRVLTAGDQIIEAVSEAAKALQQRKAERPVIIVMTVGGETPQSEQADPALNVLKNSGASLHVFYWSGLDLGKVLGDGPKRSGGSVQQVSGSVVLGPILEKVADSLLHQYVLTYTLPDGVKPNEKLALTTTRKGVTLVAPNRIADK